MKTPKIPKPEPVKVMPIPDDKMVEQAKKKEMVKRIKKGGGRMRTILGQENREKLGI